MKTDWNAYRTGYYADEYFNKVVQVLRKDGFVSNIHYQIFPRKDCVLAGIREVLAILGHCVGEYKNLDEARKLFTKISQFDIYGASDADLKTYKSWCDDLEAQWVDCNNLVEVRTRVDGEELLDGEVAMALIGNPKYFAHLETAILGVLAQKSAVATSVSKIVKCLDTNQNMFFFPARFRHPVCQTIDGYASKIGGCDAMSTAANYGHLSFDGMGTMPHLLIGCYGGDTVRAALKYDQYMPEDQSRVVLVDWDNDCINTTLKVATAYAMMRDGAPFEYVVSKANDKYDQYIMQNRGMMHHIIGKGKGKLFAVRFDTSGSNMDRSVTFPDSTKFGVCPELVFRARDAFDNAGLSDLKIIVSGGFTEEKLKEFRKFNVPFDSVGVGSSIFKFKVDFTADICKIETDPINGNVETCSKVGRHPLDWSRLVEVVYG